MSDLIQALSRLAGNRHSDGVSTLVSAKDRTAIINGCHELMLASRSLATQHQQGGDVEAVVKSALEPWTIEDGTTYQFDACAKSVAYAVTMYIAQQPLSVQEGWRPIAEADNGIAHIMDVAGLHIGNSLPIWARDIDGRVFECLWADDGKQAYWWDIEGESPVDPVEFMPHPLAAPTRGEQG